MCIRVGDNELDTVRALMAMSLNAVIADVFALPPDEINLEMNLRQDLHMSEARAQQLTEQIADFFDGLRIDMSALQTIADLFERVVSEEFEAALQRA